MAVCPDGMITSRPTMWRVALLLVLTSATVALASPVEPPRAAAVEAAPSGAPAAISDGRDEGLQHYMRGRWHESNGEPAKAFEEYARALASDPGSVELMMRLSEFLSANGDAGRALELADRALAASPGEARAHWLRGAALFNLGRTRDALVSLERAVGGDSTNVEYWRTLARAAETEDRTDLVERAWSRVSYYEEDDGEAWFQLAAIRARFGRFAAADSALRRALDLNPTRPGTFFLSGWIREGLGDADGAIQLYQNHLSLHRNDAQTRRRLTMLLAQRKRFPEALAEANQLAAARPRDPDVLSMQADLAFAARRPGEGRAAIQRLRSLAPDDPELVERSVVILARNGQGADARRIADAWAAGRPGDMRGGLLAVRARALSGDTDGAATRARALVAAAPDSVLPRRVLARILQDAKRWGDAQTELRAVIERVPDDPVSRLDLAFCLQESGDVEAAESTARDALRVGPDHAPSQNFLGYLLAEQGRNLDEALRLIQRAVQQDGDNGSYVDSLGWVYFRLGRFEEARRQLERALELTGGDPVIHEHLGDVYVALARLEQAREQYRLALAEADNSRVRNKLSGLE